MTRHSPAQGCLFKVAEVSGSRDNKSGTLGNPGLASGIVGTHPKISYQMLA